VPQLPTRSLRSTEALRECWVVVQFGVLAPEITGHCGSNCPLPENGVRVAGKPQYFSALRRFSAVAATQHGCRNNLCGRSVEADKATDSAQEAAFATEPPRTRQARAAVPEIVIPFPSAPTASGRRATSREKRGIDDRPSVQRRGRRLGFARWRDRPGSKSSFHDAGGC
jgi:hypothetical protein